MTVGASIFLIVVGAILKYAISADTWQGINVDMIGLILMIAGVVGLLIGLYFWNSANRRSASTGDGASSGTSDNREL